MKSTNWVLWGLPWARVRRSNRWHRGEGDLRWYWRGQDGLGSVAEGDYGPRGGADGTCSPFPGFQEPADTQRRWYPRRSPPTAEISAVQEARVTPPRRLPGKNKCANNASWDSAHLEMFRRVFWRWKSSPSNHTAPSWCEFEPQGSSFLSRLYPSHEVPRRLPSEHLRASSGAVTTHGWSRRWVDKRKLRSKASREPWWLQVTAFPLGDLVVAHCTATYAQADPQGVY